MSERKIRLIVIDADPLTQSAVGAHLKLHHDFEVIAKASSARNAITMVRELQPDAMFVDVEVMRSFGVDILPEFQTRPLVVVLASHRQHALEAFDLGAADYLLKPVNVKRFDLSLSRIRKQVEFRRPATPGNTSTGIMADPTSWASDAPDHITVTDKERTRLVETKDIEWIGAACDYTELHVRDRTFLLREPISALLNRLPSKAFCRIHRSFAVNLDRVSGFKSLRNQDLLVKLKDNTILRASRTYSCDFAKAIRQRRSVGWAAEFIRHPDKNEDGVQQRLAS